MPNFDIKGIIAEGAVNAGIGVRTAGDEAAPQVNAVELAMAEAVNLAHAEGIVDPDEVRARMLA